MTRGTAEKTCSPDRRRETMSRREQRIRRDSGSSLFGSVARCRLPGDIIFSMVLRYFTNLWRKLMIGHSVFGHGRLFPKRSMKCLVSVSYFIYTGLSRHSLFLKTVSFSSILLPPPFSTSPDDPRAGGTRGTSARGVGYVRTSRLSGGPRRRGGVDQYWHRAVTVRPNKCRS